MVSIVLERFKKHANSSGACIIGNPWRVRRRYTFDHPPNGPIGSCFSSSMTLFLLMVHRLCPQSHETSWLDHAGRGVG